MTNDECNRTRLEQLLKVASNCVQQAYIEHRECLSEIDRNKLRGTIERLESIASNAWMMIDINDNQSIS